MTPIAGAVFYGSNQCTRQSLDRALTSVKNLAATFVPQCEKDKCDRNCRFQLLPCTFRLAARSRGSSGTGGVDCIHRRDSQRKPRGRFRPEWRQVVRSLVRFERGLGEAFWMAIAALRLKLPNPPNFIARVPVHTQLLMSGSYAYTLRFKTTFLGRHNACNELLHLLQVRQLSAGVRSCGKNLVEAERKHACRGGLSASSGNSAVCVADYRSSQLSPNSSSASLRYSGSNGSLTRKSAGSFIPRRSVAMSTASSQFTASPRPR